MGESADGSSPGETSSAGMILGLATIYLVWGSTYLAIRIAVESIPPFLMAGVRFIIAGLILVLWAKWRGASWPTWAHLRTGAITGALMLLGGNGGVVWAETRVPSGLTAVLVSTLPFWMAVCDWIRPGGNRPALTTWLGLSIGFGGMLLLAGFGTTADGAGIDPWGVAALVGATVTWAIGTIFARQAAKPRSPFMFSGMQMLSGGIMLLAASPLAGEHHSFSLSQVSLRSVVATAYLIVAGSLLALTVYNWLILVAPPTLVSTYAFVNPIIAIFLGWLVADERLTTSTLAAALVIVAAVAWLIWVQWRTAIHRRRLART